MKRKKILSCSILLALGVIAAIPLTSCSVEAIKKATYTEGLATISGEEYVVAGEKITLTVSSDEKVYGTWGSSNKDVATVNEDGVVTGVEEGTATITYIAISEDGTKACTVTKEITVLADTPSLINVSQYLKKVKNYSITVQKSTEAYSEDEESVTYETTFEYSFAGDIAVIKNVKAGTYKVWKIDSNGYAVKIEIDAEGNVTSSERQVAPSGYVTSENFYQDADYPYYSLFPSFSDFDDNYLPNSSNNLGQYDMNTSTNSSIVDPDGESDRDTSNYVQVSRVMEPETLTLAKRFSNLVECTAEVESIGVVSFHAIARNRYSSEDASNRHHYKATTHDAGTTVIDADILSKIESVVGSERSVAESLSATKDLLNGSINYVVNGTHITENYFWKGGYSADDILADYQSSLDPDWGWDFDISSYTSSGYIKKDGVWNYYTQTATLNGEGDEATVTLNEPVLDTSGDDLYIGDSEGTISDKGLAPDFSSLDFMNHLDAFCSCLEIYGGDYGYDTTNRTWCYEMADFFENNYYSLGYSRGDRFGETSTSTPCLMRITPTIDSEDSANSYIQIGLYYRDNRSVDTTSSGSGPVLTIESFGAAEVESLEEFIK